MAACVVLRAGLVALSAGHDDPASVVDVGRGSDPAWIVMTDLGGNEFCVTRVATPLWRAEG
jgi:hypothetical protein